MTTSAVLALILANGLAWLLCHVGIAWLGTALNAGRFNPDRFWFRTRRWEHKGRVYERAFRIRAWKDRLPDGAAWFSNGFPKAELRQRTAAYRERFIRETCRGEAVHWLVAACAPLFFLWNPPWAGGVMIAYALVANLPCILVQRYNRARLIHLQKMDAVKPRIEQPATPAC